MSTSVEGDALILQKGLLQGKLPGQKADFMHLFLELTLDQLKIHTGHVDPSLPRKHLRTLEMTSSDIVSEERKKKKNLYRFSLSRADGKYQFQCPSETEQQSWIEHLKYVIQLHTEDELGPMDSAAKRSTLAQRQHPTQNVRVSIASTDSGIGPSTDGEIRRHVGTVRTGSSSLPSSGDGTFCRPTAVSTVESQDPKSFSDSGKFNSRPSYSSDPEELSNHAWFWGSLSRTDCEKRLRGEGKCGNFVVRVNAHGNYILSFWRTDSIHHYKIVQRENMWYFDRSALNAEGYSLVDLLDTYLKNCLDKSVSPLGGPLYTVYDEAWNPPDLPMEEVERKLKKVKLRGEERPNKDYHRQQQYSPDGSSSPPSKSPSSSSKFMTSVSSKQKPSMAASSSKTLPVHKRRGIGGEGGGGGGIEDLTGPAFAKKPMIPSLSRRERASASELSQGEESSSSEPTPNRSPEASFASELQQKLERKAGNKPTSGRPQPMSPSIHGMGTGSGRSKLNSTPPDHTSASSHLPSSGKKKVPLPPLSKKPSRPSEPSPRYINIPQDTRPGVWRHGLTSAEEESAQQQEEEESDRGGEDIYIDPQEQEDVGGREIYENIPRRDENEDVGGQEIYMDMSGSGQNNEYYNWTHHASTTTKTAATPPSTQYMNLSGSRGPPMYRNLVPQEEDTEPPVPPRRTISTQRR